MQGRREGNTDTSLCQGLRYDWPELCGGLEQEKQSQETQEMQLETSSEARVWIFSSVSSPHFISKVRDGATGLQGDRE